ncbi:MAG: MarR family transcriptional regulator [Rhodococcus sp. (in: high G+C Gram-positive bacteria)]
MKKTLRRRGDASSDLAWERYMDTSLWQTWSPQIQGVDASTDRLETGTTGTVHGPLGVRVSFEVLSVDEDARVWAWRAWIGAPSAGMTLEHGVEDSPRGSKTWLTVEGLAPLVLGYSPVALFALGRLVKA